VISIFNISIGEIKSKEDFDNKKRLLAIREEDDDIQEKPLCSEGKVFDQGSFLWHLQQREYDVKNGRKSTIIFIRYRDSNFKETSAYIDYRERLKTDKFEDYFIGEKDLIPRRSDLSFYNWTTQKDFSNDSTFFRVDATANERLSFRNNTDRKIINVDLEYLTSHPNLDVKRTPVETFEKKYHAKPQIINLKSNQFRNKNKIEFIEKEQIGYQQIVIFDYETRMK